jgi:hypothetical protein
VCDMQQCFIFDFRDGTGDSLVLTSSLLAPDWVLGVDRGLCLSLILLVRSNGARYAPRTSACGPLWTWAPSWLGRLGICIPLYAPSPMVPVADRNHQNLTVTLGSFSSRRQ